MIRLASLLFSLLAAATLPAQTPAEASASIQELVQEAQSATTAGRWDDAIAGWRKVTEAAPKDGRGWHMLGYSLHAAGKLDEALEIHVKAADFPGIGATAAYNAACVHALRGDDDEAIAWLEKAAEKGFGNAAHVQGDSDMDALRKDARFEKVLAKIRANESDGANRIQAYSGSNARGGSRVSFWSGAGSVGQVHVDFGIVDWNDAYDEKLEAGAFAGKRWRLGRDFWTRLDTNLPLHFGDIEVAPGLYYVTLRHAGEGKAVLELHDPAVARQMRLDAFQPDRLPKGIEVPMEWGTNPQKADKLSIDVSGVDGELGKGHVRIRFGHHALSCPFSANLEG